MPGPAIYGRWGEWLQNSADRDQPSVRSEGVDKKMQKLALIKI